MERTPTNFIDLFWHYPNEIYILSGSTKRRHILPVFIEPFIKSYQKDFVRDPDFTKTEETGFSGLRSYFPFIR
jgi:hypothetical protein